jgi:hypothetical protein
MPIWHPTDEGAVDAEVDALLAAQVDMYVLPWQLCLSCVDNSVTLSFAGAWMWDKRCFRSVVYSMRRVCIWWMKFLGI